MAPSSQELEPPGIPARFNGQEIISPYQLSEKIYSEPPKQWGEPTLVELLTLVGYFALVCWLMNVAHTSEASNLR
jgi:4-carboxymuconolactone decarboxylase